MLARTSKDLVLPRPASDVELGIAKQAPPLVSLDEATLEPMPVRPTTQLGASVISNTSRGMRGRVQVIRWNPLEGSSNGPAQVSARCNLDFQNMMRTFDYGFHEGRDELRDAPITENELSEEQYRMDGEFEASLATKIRELQKERNSKGLPDLSNEDLEARLRREYEKVKQHLRKCFRSGDRLLSPVERRFKKHIRSFMVESMASSLATTFYACDYSTKPNIVCAPLLVNLRNGLQKLQQEMEAEREIARLQN